MLSTKFRLFLTFGIVFCVMLACTVRAMMVRSVFDNAELLQDVWFQATLVDAYLAFICFYTWVFWREGSHLGRGVWLLLILSFGSMAMAAYVIIAAVRLPAGAGIKDLLTGSA